MKKYYSQNGDSISISNFPIKVNDNECQEIEITDEEMEKIVSGKYTYTIKNKKLEFIEIVKVKTAEEIAKEEIKAKLEAGTVTQDDIVNALKTLL